MNLVLRSCSAALALLLATSAISSRADEPGADPALAQQADPALKKLLPADREGQAFTLAVSLGSPPDDFRDEKGQIVGWEIDLARAAVQLLGMPLEIRPTTFDSLIPGLQAKRFDAATGQMGVSVARGKIVDQIGWLTGNELFAAKSTNPIRVNGLDDLCGVTVATTRGSREMVFVEEHQPKCAAVGKKPIEALAFTDGNGAADAMMSGRAELFWLGSTAVSYFVAQTKGRTHVVGHYTDTSYIGIALPKGSDLAKPFQAALEALHANGGYDRIVKKWGLEDGAVTSFPLNPTNVEK